MRHIATLLLALPFSTFAQQTWEVVAGGSTAPGSEVLPYYSPSELTIQVGDHVHWGIANGSHNVYGGQDLFPSNPESFISGDPSSELDFTFTFTIPGVYHYHCTQEGHANSQMGMITVEENTQSVGEYANGALFRLFPVPSNEQLTLELNTSDYRYAEVISGDGRVQRHTPLNGTVRATVDLAGLAPGRYLLRLVDAKGNSLSRPFVKEQ